MDALSFEAIEQKDQKGNNYADKNACCERKVKFEIFPFHRDVPRQFTQEWNSRPVGYEKTCGDAENSHDYQQLAHAAKVVQIQREHSQS